MWVVNGYGTLSLKAWPETNNGGAQFVFTSAENSVAVHTHGDLSSRGIIAAAVFTEGHVEPVRVTGPDWFTRQTLSVPAGPITTNHNHSYKSSHIGGVRGSSAGSYGSSGGTFSVTNTVVPSAAGSSFGDTYCSNSVDSSADLSDFEGLVSVGAGQHVEQKITYTTGLIKPLLAETVTVRYLWWDDLVAKLRQTNAPKPHASGFPADKQTHINLGSTPRIGNFEKVAFPRPPSSYPSYVRV